MSPVVEEIEALFARHGSESYGEGVTMLQHALQTAALAHADSYGYHKHDRSGGEWLAQRFGPAVSEPVRLHVAAKRYLCATEAEYFGRLSVASVHSLGKQGGPMSVPESAAFAALPHAGAAVRLRRWDDGGKVDGLHVPDLSSYRERIARFML
jgi:[1-hydroxy-2-(trimethylamino)ethyl]phosphonate dioxygenase